jgi:DNA-binding GntR family transcriptional regulator
MFCTIFPLIKGLGMATNVFSPIEQRSIQQEVVDSIRNAIVSGKLELGQHLAEVSLSEQMAVSRVPIREALRQLEQEGLVTRYNNRGCFVTDFTDEDVREVFSLRSSLECMAIEWAAPHFAMEDIEALRQLIEEQRQAVAARDFTGLAVLDMRFHEFVCIKAQHSRLLKEWYSLHAQCQMLLNRRFQTLSDYAPETVPDDHTQILNAIESKDVVTAIHLTKLISSRVELECIETLHRIKRENPNG